VERNGMRKMKQTPSYMPLHFFERRPVGVGWWETGCPDATTRCFENACV
jgi:hypothetical protein